MIIDHIHSIKDGGRVRVHPMDTKKFHDEMEDRKNARTEELRREVKAARKAKTKGPKNAS